MLLAIRFKAVHTRLTIVGKAHALLAEIGKHKPKHFGR